MFSRLFPRLSNPLRGSQQSFRSFHYCAPLFQKNAGSVTSTTSKAINITPLKYSNELYAVFRIHNRPYLVTLGDKVILPFKLKQADVGDVLNLNDVTTIGSRNYQLIDNPIDTKLFTLKATVLEKTKRAFQIREVTKRRNRRVRHAINKADLTVLRISELKVN
ncbi:hypothetical protein ZYGR_0AZ01820 [Zygosaccharomyces rouxii]|uniref:Large ribosomal subunit protein bL21m n=1 Tax=Zygosaccharomyces rouxii TaxID=4956 RepID=A0A1Q3AK43_ZYGRO|nr:hypothetical protein ZYGR_0AZ01820 [Zygosaccharomyces rouxii]